MDELWLEGFSLAKRCDGGVDMVKSLALGRAKVELEGWPSGLRRLS